MFLKNRLWVNIIILWAITLLFMVMRNWWRGILPRHDLPLMVACPLSVVFGRILEFPSPNSCLVYSFARCFVPSLLFAKLRMVSCFLPSYLASSSAPLFSQGTSGPAFFCPHVLLPIFWLFIFILPQDTLHLDWYRPLLELPALFLGTLYLTWCGPHPTEPPALFPNA